MTDRSSRERMLAGEPYLPDDELVALTRRAMRLAAAYNALPPHDTVERREVLEELLGYVGEDVEIRAPLQVDYGSHLFVGARTFVNFGLVVLDVNPVTIGEDCQIGPNVQLLAASHPLDPTRRRAKWESGKPVTIGDNVWLGGGVIVCPGVTIGDNTVVGAGSVVTKDLPANVLAFGNPARVIRALDR